MHHDTRVPPLDFDTMSADAEKIEAALFPEPPAIEHDIIPKFGPSDINHPVALVCSCGEWAGMVN